MTLDKLTNDEIKTLAEKAEWKEDILKDEYVGYYKNIKLESGLISTPILSTLSSPELISTERTIDYYFLKIAVVDIQGNNYVHCCSSADSEFAKSIYDTVKVRLLQSDEKTEIDNKKSKLIAQVREVLREK